MTSAEAAGLFAASLLGSRRVFENCIILTIVREHMQNLQHNRTKFQQIGLHSMMVNGTIYIYYLVRGF